MRAITAITTTALAVATLLLGVGASAPSGPATAGIKWTLTRPHAQVATIVIPKPDPYRKG